MLERAQRDELLRLVTRRATLDGENRTAIAAVSLLRASKPQPLRRGILEPSMCLIVRGGKKLMVGRETFRYGAGSYTCSAIDFPTAGQITDAPYLAVRLKLDPREIAEIIVEAKLGATRTTGAPVFVGDADPALIGAVLRLVQLLDEPDGGAFLARSAVREILFRLLRSPHGPVIIRSVKPAHLGVGRAVDWLRTHFERPVDIEALAKASRMSVSSLRHEFKAATALAPLQFQKQLRLQEARRLLMTGEVDAGSAAFRVGYESPSQFSREYRRMFGAPPIRDLRKHQELIP